MAQVPLRIEASHAGSALFFSTHIPHEPWNLVNFDAHTDFRIPMAGLGRDPQWASPDTWIHYLVPQGMVRLVWVHPEGANPQTALLEERRSQWAPLDVIGTTLAQMPQLNAGPLLVSIDLDWCAQARDARLALQEALGWARDHNPQAMTIAVSRPWLMSDAQAIDLLTCVMEIMEGDPWFSLVEFDGGTEFSHANTLRALEFKRRGFEVPELATMKLPPELMARLKVSIL